MRRPVYEFMAADHDRLDGLLARALADPEHIDMSAYGLFRSGILRHISMEEKVLLPEAMRLRGGVPLAIAERIRLDHGAITALMVPPPSRAVLDTLRAILIVHNALEEQEGGMYQLCEQLTGDSGEALLARLKGVAEVPLRPHNPDPAVMASVRRAVERAGYAMK
ncbi:MAG TPA: hemerythrin domain-containing protein [Bacteroidota bacterium]|nr:hemerythrin domain-containing protein [Bacteroidota bacterium]